jgi:cytochrome c-type biogenesis protein CcmE
MTQSNSKVVKFGLAIGVIVCCLFYLAWTGVQEGKSYYMTIKQLRSDPTAYSKKLRVGGTVEPGSIHKLGSNADFVLIEVDPKTKDRQTLRVIYRGTEPPPDTFKDNSEALVIGEFSKDGVFHAAEVQAKCASKYASQPATADVAPSPSPSSAKGN